MVAKMQAVPDARLRESVLREIDWEPAITSTDISVSADDGVVTLSGFVHSYAEKIIAERAAKRVFGVKAVADDIEVRPGLHLSDPEIARNALTALQIRHDVPHEKITVTVDDARITLEGNVEWQYQKRAAESAVKNLSGVRGVSNQIFVKPAASPTEVKSKIEAALKRSAEVDARRIRVDAVGNTVMLWGNVRSWAEKQEAERAAWAAPGVSRVENHIAVLP